MELRQLVLELLVNVLRAADEANGAQPGTVLIESLLAIVDDVMIGLLGVWDDSAD